MVGDRITEEDLLAILNVKCAVIFRQALIEPWRHISTAQAIIDEQVHVLVKNRAVGIFVSLFCC